MSHPFFRPQEVHAEALILVGYRLYPYASIELHPRLTLLAGGNGAGKTTILDALQTVLIADQRYIHLNVAAGQNDRDLGGQLQDRIAWAVIRLKGHEEVGGIGVQLSRRAIAERVDVSPFALMGAPPGEDLFLDRGTSRIVQDVKALSQNIDNRSGGARVREFGTVSDYHRFLFEEGLLPLDLSKGGKRQFSLLWRQATQPHLGELNTFLQKALCHEPERRLTFEDVERLMRERLHAERQLNRLGELKELNAELKEKASALNHHRRRYLAMNLGLARQREETLERGIEENEELFRELDVQVTALKAEIDGFREKLGALEKERDKYVREQGEWSRRYKHHQDYGTHRSLVESLQEEMAWAREEIYPLETKLLNTRGKLDALREEARDASNDLARLTEKQKGLERQAAKWRDFRKDLDRAATALDRQVESLSDLESAWLQINEEVRGIQELKPLKRLLAEWKSRVSAFETAGELARKVTDSWPDFFDQEPLDRGSLGRAQTALREREKEIAVRREELQRIMKSLKTSIDELSKGRLPLPPAAADLVEQGFAAPFIRHFDNLNLATARECQEAIGPLARAIEPARSVPFESGSSSPNGENERCERLRGHNGSMQLSALARGSEPFWLVLTQDAWKEFRILDRSEHGTIAAYGSIAWYTPAGPVWIGSEARRQQIEGVQEKIAGAENELRDLGVEEGLISARMKAIQAFLPRVDALSDTEAPARAAELEQWVRNLEQKAPRVEKLHGLLQKLFQRSELFKLADVSGEMKQIGDEIEAKRERLRALERTAETFRSEESQCSNELAKLRSSVQSMERQIDAARAICARLEDEEPIEVLEGRVDFGRSEELEKRIKELDREKGKVQSSLFAGERKSGELSSRYQTLGEALAGARQDLSRARGEHGSALDLWTQFYPDEEPRYVSGVSPNERERHRAIWDNLAQVLRSRLGEVAARCELRLPEEEQPDRLVVHLLQLLLPLGAHLDRLEEQYSRLQRELQRIEVKIKSHVEEVRSTVEREVRRLRAHLVRVNRILSTLHFGNIKKIHVEIEELPVYGALKKLESVLRLIGRGEAITLKEFVEKLRAFILKESNVSLTEEQIADYRSYIRIRRVITDGDGRVREGGLSSGETLGVNLALCLSVLFFLGREQGVSVKSGMLLLALDEAERLDAKALATIRDLLDEVRCQLTVAMPRPVDIPDSVCHLLTPLSQGVTHVHLYHRGENGDGNACAQSRG